MQLQSCSTINVFSFKKIAMAPESSITVIIYIYLKLYFCLLFVFLIVCLFIFDYFGLSIHPIHLCPAVEMISQLEEKCIYIFAISNQS